MTLAFSETNTFISSIVLWQAQPRPPLQVSVMLSEWFVISVITAKPLLVYVAILFVLNIDLEEVMLRALAKHEKEKEGNTFVMSFFHWFWAPNDY